MILHPYQCTLLLVGKKTSSGLNFEGVDEGIYYSDDILDSNGKTLQKNLKNKHC